VLVHLINSTPLGDNIKPIHTSFDLLLIRARGSTDEINVRTFIASLAATHRIEESIIHPSEGHWQRVENDRTA
jgi:hypothetical protein